MENVNKISKQSRSFLSKNLDIYLELSESLRFKYYQSLLVIFLSFLEIFTANVHCYREFYVKNESILDFLITAFSYFDVFNIMSVNASVFNSLFYILCSLAYFYACSYLILLIIHKTRIKKHPITAFFVYFSKYYSWLLFFPTNLALSSRILCPPHVFKALDLQCPRIFPTDDVVSLFLAVSALFCANFMVFLNGFFAYSTWYTKSDYFATHYERFIPLYNVFLLIISVLMAIPAENGAYIAVYLAISLLSSLTLLFFLLKFFPFSKFAVLKTFMFLTILYISETFAMLLDYSTLTSLYASDGKTTNFLYFFVICFALFEKGGFAFLEFELISLAQSPDAARLDFPRLIKKIRVFHYISSSFEPAHVIFYKGILAYHFEKCTNSQCFCKRAKVYDAKKARDLEISKRTALKGFFAKFLIRNWFELHFAGSSKDPRPGIFYADFLFNKMRNIHVALTNLSAAERKVFAFNDRRKILQQKLLIKAFIEEKNSEFCDSQLNFEIIVFLEEQLASVISLKRRFLKRSVKFWKLLENSFLDLTELNGEIAKLIQIKQQIAELWSPLKPYLDLKKQLKFYYQWYLKFILNKKLKVADEEIKTLENADEDETLSVYSKELLSSDAKNQEKLIYQHDCCVFHVKSSGNTLGNVSKANSAVSQVFHYNTKEIVGSEVTRLMAPFFARNHASYVENFMKTSKMKVIYNTKYAFAMDKEGYVFPIWLTLKQNVDNAGFLEYISMIKPLKSKKYEANYIILNEFGVIDGISKGICEQLLIDSEFIKRNSVNILFISPKLVKYFAYEKFLKKDEDAIAKKKKKRKETLLLKKRRKSFKEPKEVKESRESEEKTNKTPLKKKWMFAATAGNKELEPENARNNANLNDNSPGLQALRASENRKSVAKPANLNLSPIDTSNPKHPTKKMNLKEIAGIGMRDSVNLANLLPDVKDSSRKSEKNQEESEHHHKSEKNSESSSEDSSSDSMNFTDELTEENVITFIVKLPKNLEKHVEFYKELLTKKQEVSYSTLNSIKLFSKTIKEGENDQKNDDKTPKKSKFDRKPQENRQDFEELNRNHYKQGAILANLVENATEKLEENYKKELKAIVLTADRISKNKFLNIYKVKAIIKTKLYGENNKDVLKVLKILSIQKKVEKFSKQSNSRALSNINEEFVKSSSNIQTKAENEKILNLSPTLTNKFFHSRTNTNELSASNLDDLKNEPNSQGEIIFNEAINQNDNINDKESLKDLSIIPSQDKILMKSFQKTKNVQNENLFLKEDTMKARRNLRSISKIKWFIRILFLLIFTLSLLTYFLGPFTEFQNLKNQSEKIYLTKSNELKILQSYNIVLNFIFLTNGFFTGVLSETTLTMYLNQQISHFTQIYQSLISLDQDSLMKNVIYDPTVFPDENLNYSTEMASKSDIFRIQNKDLLFIYIEKLNNVYNSTDWSKIDVNSTDIIFFRSYIVPELITLLKNIGVELFESIDKTRVFIDDFMLYILISEVSLLCLTFFILLRYIFQVTSSFQSILEIFTYIENSDVRQIKRHFLETLKTFAATNEKNNDDNITEKTSKISKGDGTFIEQGKRSGVGDKSDQQFKKLKKFKVGNFLSNMKKKVFFYYFLFIAVTSCLSIGFFFLVRTATQEINTLLVNGNYILGMIEIDSFLLVALKEIFYDPGNYKTNIYPKIAKELPLYLQLETDLYLPSINYANFDQVSLSYFYGNPCVSYGRLNTSEIQECSNVSLGKLSLGMISFNNYFFTKISDYLTLKNEIKFGDLNPDQIYEFDRAVYYSNQFVLDILLVWSKDMSSILDTSSNNLTIYLVFMLFSLIGAYIIAENLVVGQLRNSFKYYRQIYNNFMPTELVSKERLIKAKLVISNVLDR